MRNQAKVATAMLSMVLTLSLPLAVPAWATTTPPKVQSSKPIAPKPGVIKPSTATPSIPVYVNGKDLTNQGEPTYRGGVLYVPIEPVVTGMGDTFKYTSKPYSAVITKKDGTQIQVSVTKSVATVNDKEVPVSTKNLKNTKVPVQAIPVVVNNKMYVPFDFVINILKYPLETSKSGSKELIFVGTKPSGTVVTPTPTPTPVPKQPNNGGAKLDLPYQPPSGWVPPHVTSSATEDYKKNWQILDDELGLTKGSWYNPYGKDAYQGVAAFLVDHDSNKPEELAIMTFYYWKGAKAGDEANQVPYVAREVFKFYFPNSYQKLFKIMDDGYNGKDDPNYIGKIFTLDCRQVKIVDGEAVRVIVGVKGKNLK